MKPIWKYSNIGKAGRIVRELRLGFIALRFAEAPQLVHYGKINPWFDLQRGCLAVSFLNENVFVSITKKFKFSYSTFPKNKNKKGSEQMNEANETLNPLPTVAMADVKLTPGGGEIIASEDAQYVQTETEVGEAAQ